MKEQANEIDLDCFCAEEGYAMRRLERPFVWKGWKYATDGRVLVRVPAPGEPDSSESDGGKVPKGIEDLIKPVDGDWMPWPEVEPCESCRGDGMTACPGCECGHCDGDKDIECTDCHSHRTGLDIAGIRVARHFAGLIADLPGVEYSTDVRYPQRHGMVQFRFDGGGEGAVMEIKAP